MGVALRRICTILARGGSKGLPGKNLRRIAGKPLVAHAIEQARAADIFDVIVVDSDAEKILDAAREWGAEHLVRRPAEMATDTASKMPPIRNAALEMEGRLGATFDVIVDLDVTSPLRLPDDIRGAVRLQEARGVSSVITGSVARKSPYFNLVEREDCGAVRVCKPLPATVERRQDCPECFDMNAAVYVWRRDTFLAEPRVFYPDTLLYEMPSERSHDIDTPLDFDFVEFLMSRRQAV